MAFYLLHNYMDFILLLQDSIYLLNFFGELKNTINNFSYFNAFLLYFYIIIFLIHFFGLYYSYK
ncbi:hypothetical protein EB14_00951 [Enterococcus faecium]|nr:hypothetical protein EB14_00951 [Enterococcus faecium]GIP74213.1 hypothetical protein EFM1_30020 [Enterococcus faecium]GJG92771.1 hypothetical protein EFL1_29100 [Enterococcus faecium]